MYKYEYKWEDLCVSHDITASGKREEAQGEEKKQREKERKEERKKKEMGSNAPLKVQAILLDATPNGRHAPQLARACASAAVLGKGGGCGEGGGPHW